MVMRLILIILGLICFLRGFGQTDNMNMNRIFYMAIIQTRDLSGILPDSLHYPRSVDQEGNYRIVSPADWTSGFFPGSLWYLFENTGYSDFKGLAQKWTMGISSQRYNTGTHDLGFMFNCSFGNGYRLTGDDSYRNYMIDAAKSLSTRFNPVVGCIRSWDFGPWQFPVIIDNMMNLELLFRAFHETGDSSYYQIAVQHARTTMKNHFRSDYSSWHVVDYDPQTGTVLGKYTHQGASDSSDWARGQAWGLYGYVMCYRETGDTAFLHQAEHIARFILTYPAMPADRIPYWDYLAPGIPDEPRDASAAAITASALLELSGFDPADSALWFNGAVDILHSLASAEYLATPGGNHYFILKHSTGSKPSNSEVDVPVNWADYYFLEALTRYRQKVETDNPPEIITGSYGTFYAGDTSRVRVTGLDLDKGDSVTLTLVEAPAFVVLRPAEKDSARLLITPQTDDTGSFIVKIAATDRKGNRTEKILPLEVKDPLWHTITVTASEYQDPNLPENTLDGNPDTRWSAEGDGQWITYDLGVTVNLQGVLIAFYLGNQRQAYFRVQVSQDGTQYRTVLYGTSSGNTNGLELFALPDTVPARYIRIVGFGNSRNKWNSLTEVDFDFERIATAIHPLSISDRALSLDCYPNPAENILNVFFFPVMAGAVMVRLYTLVGELCLEKRLTGTGVNEPVTFQMDLSGFRKGVYVLSLSQGGAKESLPVLKR